MKFLKYAKHQFVPLHEILCDGFGSGKRNCCTYSNSHHYWAPCSISLGMMSALVSRRLILHKGS